ncbi:predicted protein [Arabidopsis lyrata subsp. lyrata]|uniref:Predicted protein n=1 Tax=Arabidopsis lyrata subsp. lyrata TaxID=81972 RepID=D7L784_ARALL|nr:predicted protein [Arabidopsis lyrata subsp. lyrata]
MRKTLSILEELIFVLTSLVSAITTALRTSPSYSDATTITSPLMTNRFAPQVYH